MRSLNAENIGVHGRKHRDWGKSHRCAKLAELQRVDRKVLAMVTKPAASNPLLTYIIPDIIYYLTALLGIIIVPHFARSGWPGILWSAFFAVAVMGIVILLNKMKLKLQL